MTSRRRSKGSKQWQPTVPSDLTAQLAAADHIRLEDVDPLLTEDDVPGSKLDLSNLDIITTKDLRVWLKCRGEPSSGNRAELLTLVERRIASGTVHILDPRHDNYKWYNMKKEELQKQDPSIRPPLLPLFGWGQFPSEDIPDQFNWGHAHVYLIENAPNWEDVLDIPDEAMELLEALSQDIVDTVGRTDLARKGVRFVNSDHVLEIMDTKTEDFYFVKARIQASQRSDVYFCTTTIRRSSGSVRACTCTCTLRCLGRCSHVASMLMFITRHTEEEGYGAKSCTDRACAWGQGSAVRDPGRIKDKHYGSETHVARAYFDPRPTRHQNKTPAEKMEMRHSFLKSVQRLYVTEHKERIEKLGQEKKENDVRILFDLHLHFYYEPYQETAETLRHTFPLCKEFLKNLRATKHRGPYQVPDTLLQSESETWLTMRCLLFTASLAKRLYHMTPAGYKTFLRDHLWRMNTFRGNSYTRYGLKSEAKAREKYEETEKTKDPSVTVKTTGLWRNPDCMEFGCTPDGIVLSKTKPPRLLELKCPPTLKRGHPKDFEKLLTKTQQGRFCLERDAGGNIHLKTDHDYWYQVQFSLGILKMDHCDFVVWTPKGIFQETIEHDPTVWAAMVRHLIPLHHKLLIPEYFLRRVPRDMDPCLLKY